MAVDAGTIYSEIRVKLDQLSGDITKVQGLFDKIPQAGKEAATKTATAMNSITTAIKAAATSFALTAGIIKGIEFNKAAESAQVSFGVMLGSAEKARDMLASMKKYADNTPLEFKDIRSATQTMLQFGISGKDAMMYIKQLGDVSGGDAERLQSLSLAFSQISATGRLMGQDLNQLINAGFNPLKEISQTTGVSMAKLKKQMEDGDISFQMVADSFKRVTSEGGQFYGMLAQNAGTLAGAQSTLNDALDTTAGRLTEVFSGPLKALAQGLTAFLNLVQQMPGPVLAIVGTLAAMAAGMGAVAASSAVLLPALLPILATATPFLAVAGAIVAIGVGISAIGPEMDKYQARLVENVKLANQQKQEAIDTIGPIDELNRYQEINADQVAKLVKLYPELSLVLKAGQTTLEDAAFATQKAAEANRQLAHEMALQKPSQAITQAYLDIQAYTKGLDNANERFKQAMSSNDKAAQVRESKHVADMQNRLDAANKSLKAAQAERDKINTEFNGFKAYQIDRGGANPLEQSQKEIDAAKKTAEEKAKIEADYTKQLNKEIMDRVEFFDQETKDELKILKEKGVDTAKYEALRLLQRQQLLEDIDQAEIDSSNKKTELDEKEAKEEKDKLDQMAADNWEYGQKLAEWDLEDQDRKEKRNKQIVNDFRDTFSQITGLAMEFYNALNEANANELQDELDALQASYDEKERMRNEALDAALAAIDEETQEKLRALGLQDLTKIESLQKQLQEAIAAGDTEKAAELQKEIDKQKILDESEKKKQKIRDDADAAKIVADKKLAKEKAEIQYKTDKAAWDSAGLQIQVAAALAIMNAWANSKSWYEGLILTVALAAVDIAQTAAWVKAEPKKPSFATGGIVPGSSFSGDRVSINANSGEMVINGSQQKMLADMLFGGTSGGGNTGQVTHITIQLQEKTIVDVVLNAINNGNAVIKI